MSERTIERRRAAATGTAGRLAEQVRGLTAGAVLISAYIHLELWFEGFGQISVVGPLFLLNAIGGLVIAVAVLGRWWLGALGAAGFGALTLAAFFVSVTAGLFGVHETVAGLPQVAALVAEAVALAGGLGLLLRDRHAIAAALGRRR